MWPLEVRAGLEKRGLMAADLAELITGAKAGDQASCRELYRQSRPYVVRLLAQFSGLDSDDVEDVVQDSFVRAFRSLPRLREPSAFLPWLLSIARNRARSALAASGHKARSEEALLLEVETAAPALPAALKLERDIAVVRTLIEELPAGAERQTVELFYVDGTLSARQIAERLGVTKSAVTMRLDRFRARIKANLLLRLLKTEFE